MLVMETIAKIRRAYFSQKKPIKEICRELRVSRKVVRKVNGTKRAPEKGAPFGADLGSRFNAD